MNCILRISILALSPLYLFSSTLVSAAEGDIVIGRRRGSANKYTADLEEYAKYAEVTSAGFGHGNQVLIRIGKHTFYENVPPGPSTAGLYAAAIYQNRVILQNFYNTYITTGSLQGLARDLARLPEGAFVVIAAKDEPTRNFDKRTQKFLYQIGADTGLLGQEFRTSYLCIGIKGLKRGNAIEMIGPELLKHQGAKADTFIDLVFRKEKQSHITLAHGIHEGLMVGDTEVVYYIPKSFKPGNSQYLFTIHSFRGFGRLGAIEHIRRFERIADENNLVLIAPVFSCLFSRKVTEKDFKPNGGLKDRGLIKNMYLSEFDYLLNRFNEHRSDLKLIEIFEFFNDNLMKRKKFHLYGHFKSAGFVQRFAMFHPELIDKAAISLADSYTFPLGNKDYPFGLRMRDLEKTFGDHTNPDGIRLKANELDRKLNNMLDLDIFIIAGEKDKRLDSNKKTVWQGNNRVDKANNFYREILNTDKRLKGIGLRGSAKPVGMKLDIIPGMRSNPEIAAKKAVKLMFDVK